MQPPEVIELTPPDGTDVTLLAAKVTDWHLGDVPLAQPAEVATFVTSKRRHEHLTGRWLLGQALRKWGVTDLSVVEVVRDEHRAPSLLYIQGVWKRTALPNFSITHSEGVAFLALTHPGRAVGLDAEPLDRTLAENAFDMMAKGVELEALRGSPQHVFQAWTGKEAVQKCLGLGMHLNPREIEIPIGPEQKNISIGNLNIQLVYWAEIGYHLSLALRPEAPSKSSPEERILEETRLAMQADPDWGVGCKTQRQGA
jgi:phosphopantetheinyl transferase